MNAIEAHALAASVEERIRVLWAEREWWRRHRWADWPDIRHDHDVQLRELVRLAREARKIAASIPDPLTLAKAQAFDVFSPEGYQQSIESGLTEWVESEMAAAWGR